MIQLLLCWTNKMATPKGEDFKQYFVRTSNDSLMCTFCKVSYKDPSHARIRLHLSGTKGHGINICEKVSPDVKAKAWKAVVEANRKCGNATIDANKKRKTMPSSSCNEEHNLISGQQNHEVKKRVRDKERMQTEVLETEEVGEAGMENHLRNHV